MNAKLCKKLRRVAGLRDGMRTQYDGKPFSFEYVKEKVRMCGVYTISVGEGRGVSAGVDQYGVYQPVRVAPLSPRGMYRRMKKSARLDKR